jgi:hypothetical protein
MIKFEYALNKCKFSCIDEWLWMMSINVFVYKYWISIIE